MPLVTSTFVLARSGVSGRSQPVLLSLLIVYLVGAWILYLFRRRVGGIDPKTGRPGGSESEFVAAVWFLLAPAGALYITYSGSSSGHGVG